MAHGIYEKRPHKSQMLGDLLSCNLRPWQANSGETRDIIQLIAVLICLSKDSEEVTWRKQSEQEEISRSGCAGAELLSWGFHWMKYEKLCWSNDNEIHNLPRVCIFRGVAFNNGHYCASFREIKKPLFPDNYQWLQWHCGDHCDHSWLGPGAGTWSWHPHGVESAEWRVLACHNCQNVTREEIRRSLKRNLETFVTQWHITCTLRHESRALHVTRDGRALRPTASRVVLSDIYLHSEEHAVMEQWVVAPLWRHKTHSQPARILRNLLLWVCCQYCDAAPPIVT